MNVNHILSGQAGIVRPVPGISPPVVDRAEQDQSKSSPIASDRFTTDQPWKNKASTSETSGTGCRCGSCPQCGAEAYAKQQNVTEVAGGKPRAEASEQASQEMVSSSGPKGPTGDPLRPEELAQLQELQKIDQQVRAHEQAHMGAAGGLATSGISLSYAKGPDGRNYAVGGEVSIDTSAASTPSETISKMMKVRAAALAPADPSGQDRKVAASASVRMGEARTELQIEQQEGGGQAVEGAVDRILSGNKGEAEDDSGSESTFPAPPTGGRYQQNQYQRVARAGGGV